MIDYGKSHPSGKKISSRNRRGLGRVTIFKILNPRQYFSDGWSCTLMKFGKCIDYAKSHSRSINFPSKGSGLCHVIVFEI